MTLTIEILKKYLHYDPLTGTWTWLRTACSTAVAGSIAGTISVHGYRIITFRGTKHRSGRLAWFYMTGEWPSEEIDHEDRDKTNDRWFNLRDLDHPSNQLNRDLQSNNASGARGVHWDENRFQWCAQVKKDGINYFAGRFNRLENAIAARDTKAIELHGSLAQLNTPMESS